MAEPPVKLKARGVWKLFGPGAALARRRGAEAALQVPDTVAAVRDASLEVRRGEIFVIMGLSGSGKSTLVRCLSRLVEPSAGEILFDGRDLLTAPEREMIEIRRRRMGMVFQHFALLPHLDVLANVAFPLSVQGVGRPAREARARAMIELVGLGGREHYFPRQLSGGQQQRVGIARSLAGDPELWFLDEPFSALDPLIRREMQDEFIRLQNTLNKTIVFITHDVDEAVRLADHIAIMKDGAIIQAGTPEALVLRPASDYVAEFTRHVPRARVLTAGAIMDPPEPGTEVAGTVGAGQKVVEVMAAVTGAERPFAVAGPDGRPVGLLRRQAVIDLLVGRSAAA